MSSEWKSVKLGEVSKLITDKIELNELTHVNYISTDNMLPDFGGVVNAVSLPNVKRVNAFLPEDILFSNIRTYFKKLWFATISGGCSADVLVFRPKISEINSRFLSYVLKNNEFISYTVTTSKGTKMPRGDKKAILDYCFKMPNLIHQKKITNVLSTLDNKIELNKKINQTLESIAQTIFKSWFVDFDPVHAKANANSEDEYDAIANKLGISREILDLFPNEFEESELGLIPSGWNVRTLKDVLILNYGKALKKEHRKNGHFPVYGSGGIIGLHSAPLVSGPGIIVGRKGTVGSLYYEYDDFFPIDTTFYVLPKDGFSLSHLYYLLLTQNLQNMNTDAAVPGLNRNNVYRLKVSIPNSGIINAFFKISDNFKIQIAKNLEQIKCLTNIQDLLLPKLLSGEIDVSNLKLEPEHD